ncbi:MAG: tRNA-dihydrouridine synthase family protein [Proteobacteria bacterium]|nr:tRNA-dihydrouridine synthase family protein [Pseudomonadota bacterium]
MVGLSHVAFRELVREYTPPTMNPLRFTEMLSTRRLLSERLDDSNELMVAPGEDFFVPQLLGNEERFISASVKKLQTLKPWGFDINMGCPQTHILKHNWGVRLMGDQGYAADVVKMVKRHTNLPVSVKLRGGADKDVNLDYLRDFTGCLEDAGLDWLTIHPRPKAAKHEGLANWSVVEDIARVRRIPVVANGDIQTADDAIHVVQQLGCSGAMIARAAAARPWILWQIGVKLGIEQPIFEGKKVPETPEEEATEYYRAVLRFIDILIHFFGDTEYSLQKARFFIATGSRWFLFGHSFWRISMKAKSLEDMKTAIRIYSETHSNKMYGRIDL